MNEVKRISDKMIKSGITAYEISLNTGISESTIGRILSGKTKKPNASTVKELLNYLQLENKHASNIEAKEVYFTELHVMYVPLVSKFAYAGYLGGFGDDEYVGDLPKIPFANGFRPKGNYLCFEVRGDSMTSDSRESIEEGDIVLCREVQKQHWVNKLHISQWDFVIVHKEEGILVKRILYHDTQTGTLTLHSLNDYYEDFNISLNYVSQIFNIVEITKKPRR